MKANHSPRLGWTKFPIACAASCMTILLLTQPAKAAGYFVNWGGDYVTNDAVLQHRPAGITPTGSAYTSGVDVDGDGFADDSRFGAPLHGDPLSPASGYSGTSDTFYGGITINLRDQILTSQETISEQNFNVSNSGTHDEISVMTQHSQNDHHTFSLAVYWDDLKNPFLSEGNSFASDTAFTFTTRQPVNVTNDTHLHFLIRRGTSQFYTSTAYWGETGSGPGCMGAFPDGYTVVMDPTNPYWSSWRPYNEGLDANGLMLPYTHDGTDVTLDFSTINDITAVGFYIDNRNFTQNVSDLQITGFSVIPEPSQALILFGSLAMLSLLRRR